MGKKRIERTFREACSTVHDAWDQSAERHTPVMGTVALEVIKNKEPFSFEYFLEPQDNGRLMTLKVNNQSLRAFSTTDDPAAYILAIEPTIRRLFIIAFPESKEFLGWHGS